MLLTFKRSSQNPSPKRSCRSVELLDFLRRAAIFGAFPRLQTMDSVPGKEGNKGTVPLNFSAPNSVPIPLVSGPPGCASSLSMARVSGPLGGSQVIGDPRIIQQ